MLDHLIVNRVIMVLYALNVGVNVYTRHWADACYWLSALGITASVTYGLR
jgi:hypothetical protein